MYLFVLNFALQVSQTASKKYKKDMGLVAWQYHVTNEYNLQPQAQPKFLFFFFWRSEDNVY